MKLKTNPSLAMRVRRLAHHTCANYSHGKCLLLDDGEESTCIQLLSLYGVYCNYFKNIVLPADKKLYREIVSYTKNKNKTELR